MNEEAFILSKLQLQQELTILDIPCGTGSHSALLAERGFHVTGVDISPSCISIAQKRSKLPPLKYSVGDMKDLSPYSESFDCVLNLFSSFGYFSTDDENE